MSECGADDYIAKPFSLAVLKARILALLRRQERTRRMSRQLCSGAIRLDEKEMKAYRGEESLDLSLTEFRLLKLFWKTKKPGAFEGADIGEDMGQQRDLCGGKHPDGQRAQTPAQD